jgi:hypothetical protein
MAELSTSDSLPLPARTPGKADVERGPLTLARRLAGGRSPQPIS